MGWQDWLKFQSKSSQKAVHSSTDFRANKVKQANAKEPELPPLTTLIALPFLGPVRAYYLLLLSLFILYIPLRITPMGMFVGLAGGATLVFIVIWEFYSGIKTGGWKNEVKETLLALAFAAIVWFGSGLILNTSTPINAIVSCSMLPAYERGDMVILQGANVRTSYFNYDGPASDISQIATISSKTHGMFKVNGSILSACSQGLAAPAICMDFVSHPDEYKELHGPVAITYGYCKKISGSGDYSLTMCAKDAYVAGKKVDFDSKNELIVYTPKEGDIYGKVGDIVHRAAFAINTTDGLVYFTKGDNNPIYDFQAYDSRFQMGNTPVSGSQIKGKVIFRLPFIGNLKLFITPAAVINPAAMSGCDTYLEPQ